MQKKTFLLQLVRGLMIFTARLTNLYRIRLYKYYLWYILNIGNVIHLKRFRSIFGDIQHNRFCLPLVLNTITLCLSDISIAPSSGKRGLLACVYPSVLYILVRRDFQVDESVVRGEPVWSILNAHALKPVSP